MDAALPPFAELLKLRAERAGDRLRFVMPFHDDVMGRPGFLHGGAIAALLEFAAYGQLREEIGGDAVTIKPITVTTDYMRGGRDHDTYADAIVERLGRRIANVDAFAWQDSRDTPIASARMNVLIERD